MSDTAVRLSWQVPEYPNGGITKYIVELQQVGGTSEPQWIDTDNGAETTKIVGGLNASTTYQFRVRANSHVPGEWSQPVKAKTLGDGEWGVPRVSSRQEVSLPQPLPTSPQELGALCWSSVSVSGAAERGRAAHGNLWSSNPSPNTCVCLHTSCSSSS